MPRIVALVLVCACFACESAPEPTQTIVVVDADEAVRGLTKRVRVLVQSISDDKRDEERSFRAGDWPARLPVVPLHGDAKREFHMTVEALREDGMSLVSTHVRAGFVEHHKRYVHVRLSKACLDRVCGKDSTCRAGECLRVSRAPLCASSSPCGEQEEEEIVDGGHKQQSCGQNELLCAGRCVAADSVEHCGGCDHDCSELPNVRTPARCEADRCVFEPAACMPGHGDCNGETDDGCETELHDAEHCGACDVACRPDVELCAATPNGHACVPNCPADKQVLCGDACVDTKTSTQHCGTCGAACKPGMRCEAGQCQPICPEGQLACGGACVDTQQDDRHCGGCGAACGKDHVCQGGSCVSCVQGATCVLPGCRGGVTECAGGPMCKEQGPASDGAACGEGAACAGGFCACSASNGSIKRWAGCVSDKDCVAGHACVDLGGNNQFFCKPLCWTDADCAPHREAFPQIRCSAAMCASGKKPGVGVCVEQDSRLHPAYDATSCCVGSGTSAAAASGCADGTREAFTDAARFPYVAGCEARWPLGSLRTPPTGRPCGNGMSIECSVPADACALGWHVCAAPPYGATDLSDKVTARECASQQGRYAAAVSDVACDSCDDQAYGAACCGTECIQGNGSCVFPQATASFGSVNGRLGLCGGLTAAQPNQGVLCCRGT